MRARIVRRGTRPRWKGCNGSVATSGDAGELAGEVREEGGERREERGEGEEDGREERRGTGDDWRKISGRQADRQTGKQGQS